ncbi:ATP-binding protein [Streptomyces avicenniae]|uniref:ATP-binding protein n=1 Tax=Streptomyces avicenniae TaxID=500153 RepID=UPI00069A2D32|nr:ATP-binding protein [Streptomyces avicenniae]
MLSEGERARCLLRLLSEPYAVGSVPVVRRRVRGVLAGWGMDAGTVADAAVVVSELATNAVVHARPVRGGRLIVQVSYGGRDALLRLLVVDGAPEVVPPGCVPMVRPSSSAEGGRGMTLVAGMCLAWGVDLGVETKSVWALLPTGARAGAS